MNESWEKRTESRASAVPLKRWHLVEMLLQGSLWGSACVVPGERCCHSGWGQFLWILRSSGSIPPLHFQVPALHPHSKLTTRGSLGTKWMKEVNLSDRSHPGTWERNGMLGTQEGRVPYIGVGGGQDCGLQRTDWKLCPTVQVSCFGGRQTDRETEMGRETKRQRDRVRDTERGRLSLYVSLCVSVSVYVGVYIFVAPCVCLSVCYVYVSVCVFVCVFLCACMCFSVSQCLSISVSVCVYI